jgi:hypothetical protein
MTDDRVPSTRSPGGVAQRERASGLPAAVPAPAVRSSGWTAGRITALVLGAIVVLLSLGLLGAGGTALWADRAHRDAAGYVTTGAHGFSTDGSAVVTAPAELDSPGVGWLYSSVVLGNVRIQVTPADPQTPVFVGIGPSDQVDRYVAGMSHALISDFWSERVRTVPGGMSASPPGTQDFWVASATGPGTQTLTWDAANGSWSVVVMNADGRPGVDVRADLGATFPALVGIAIGSLVIGALFLIGGALGLASAIRRIRAGGAATS